MDHRLGVNVSKTGNTQKVDQERGSQSNRSCSCYGLSPSAAHCTASRVKEKRGAAKGERSETRHPSDVPPHTHARRTPAPHVRA